MAKGQTMIYKTLLRTLQIDQLEIFFLCNKCTLKGYSETFPVFENKGKKYNQFHLLMLFQKRIVHTQLYIYFFIPFGFFLVCTKTYSVINMQYLFVKFVKFAVFNATVDITKVQLNILVYKRVLQTKRYTIFMLVIL